MSVRPSDAGSIRSDLKIIVIGSSGTGKTSYVNKWTKNIFKEEYQATIVSEFGFKIFEYEGKLYRIQLWDLAGEDKRFSWLYNSYRCHKRVKFRRVSKCKLYHIPLFVIYYFLF